MNAPLNAKLIFHAEAENGSVIEVEADLGRIAGPGDWSFNDEASNERLVRLVHEKLGKFIESYEA